MHIWWLKLQSYVCKEPHKRFLVIPYRNLHVVVLDWRNHLTLGAPLQALHFNQITS